MIFTTIVLAVLVFALMVLVHELGHFTAAKLAGVRVVEFALGLGPALIKKQWGETVYAIRALPFGGQCVMEGEDEESDDPRSFLRASPWKRVVILTAGVVMNFVMGFVILLLVYSPLTVYNTPQIDSLMEKFTGGGPAGIQPGDTLVEIDGYNIYVASDISSSLSRGADAYYDVTVRRDGQIVRLSDVHIAPQPYESEGKTVYYYGFHFKTIPATPLVTLKNTWFASVNMVRAVVSGLQDLFRGRMSVQDMSGPVGITAFMSGVAQESMSAFWQWAALIAINLSVMNLLPLPALDGGRLVFVFYEIIVRRAPNRRVEGYVHAAGLVLLLLLMAFVAFNDIWKLIV